ncbi:hypothetical protein C2845_PM16G03590 [Panicum miliaceum]|uniref:Uncharacterized protein n=1 Tax=Panicum miliaceum TaxID=4540 RepID=A0A3L6PUZ0_PANMI|nr:hypothetical protein C2845_PM16G03590 [Panicum miliaceum]
MNPRLHNVIPSITINKQLPSFLKVRSHLLLEKHRVNNAAKLAQQAAAFFTQQKGSNGIVVDSADSVLLGLNAQSAPAAISTTSSSTGSLGKKPKNKKMGFGNGGGTSNNNGCQASLFLGHRRTHGQVCSRHGQ